MTEPSKNFTKPYVVIFGDGDEKRCTKATWNLLAGSELELVNVEKEEELQGLATGAVLMMVVLHGPNDPNIELAGRLSHNPRVVSDIIAVADEATLEERLEVMRQGFDVMFNLSFMDSPDFKQVLLNRIEKGFISLENRIQQEEYKRFKAALAASPDAFIVFDENNKLFFASEHYLKAYPKTGRGLVRGIDVLDAFEMCSAEQGVRAGHPQHARMREFWLRMEGEEEFELEGGRHWSIKAKKLPEGQGTIVTTTDITRFVSQQREIEQKSDELETALEKEQEASAIQKQFINMVSHEFRTPLSIIDGNAQLLVRRLEEIDTDTIQKRARTIRSAVSRLVNMMEGVLSSNMLKTGNLKLEPEKDDLRGMITELCNEHADLSNNHKITTDLAALPDEVWMDRKLMALIISNLLSNAVKFTRENPEIHIKGWQDDSNVYLSFKDNGIGIPENEIVNIFKRFFRTTTSSGIPGSGIGLNLTKELVELHKGSIEVKSTLGHGTEFVVTLPREI